MNLQKKLKNVYTLGYLMKLDKKIPEDPAKIKAKQNKNIHEIMKIAYDIPFYRKRFEASGTTPEDYHCSEDLEKFPTCNKADLRLWMQKEYEDHPEMHDVWDVLSTSGSSGIPLKFLQTQQESACVNANWIRVLMMAGYNPFTGKMFSFETSHKHVSTKKNDSFVQSLGILRRMVVSEKDCVGDGIKGIIDQINDYQPDMLCFRRNALVRIALYAKKHQLPLYKPTFYVPVSEMVDEMTKKLLHETFGDGLIDAYGCSETGSCIIKYPQYDTYRIMNDTHVVNIYDEENHLANNGKVILTTLYKKTFPIINYEIGDLAESYVEDGIRYVTAIQGRMNDLVKHESGVESSALELMKIPNGTVGIAQFRFIQETYHTMCVQLVADPNNTSKSKEEIEAYIQESMAKLYGDEFTTRIDWMEMLPPDANGKMRCFACKVEAN